VESGIPMNNENRDKTWNESLNNDGSNPKLAQEDKWGRYFE